MILLSLSDFPVEDGLQSIFQSSNEGSEVSDATLNFLIVSLIWSFKTSAVTSIKIKSDTKRFLPFVSKMILGLRYLLIFLLRISIIVAYFSPFIGGGGFFSTRVSSYIYTFPKSFSAGSPKFQRKNLSMSSHSVEFSIQEEDFVTKL